MTPKLFLYFLIFFNVKVISQVNCDSLKYPGDSVAMYNNEIFTGSCDYQARRHIAKNYFYAGYLDSVISLDKKGRRISLEIFCENYNTTKFYFKNGFVSRSINFKNDKCFGYWREYYKNGKIKYEAEYLENEELKDGSYYTWDKQGQKYLHALIDLSKTKRIGKLEIHSLRTSRRKTLIKKDS